MSRSLKSWLVVALLLGTMAYAVAEDLTVSTYYPSPRGVYDELRAMKNAFFATQTGRVGIGTTTPSAKLSLTATDAVSNLLAITTSGGTMLSINPQGAFGIGADPVDVDGTAKPGILRVSAAEPALRIDSPGVGNDVGVTLRASQSNGGEATLITRTNHPLKFGANKLTRLTILKTGEVGIGTETPATTLEVAGNTTSQTVTLNPLASAPVSPTEGMLYFNQPEGTIYFFANNAWHSLVQFLGQLLGERISPASQTLTGSYVLIGGGSCPGSISSVGTSTSGNLCVTNLTPQKGLYSISWSGTVSIDAEPGCEAKLQIKVGSDTVIDSLSLNDDDGAKDGTPTVAAIDGGTLLLLGKNINPKVRIIGKKTCGAAKNSSTADANMELRVDLTLPF